jgi:hypothetical protein
MKLLNTYFSRLGVQRSILVISTLILCLLSFFSAGEISYSGWRAVPTLVAPALVPIAFFLLALDILMSLVFMADKAAEARRRYVFIMRSNLVLIVVLCLAWARFFYALVQV